MNYVLLRNTLSRRNFFNNNVEKQLFDSLKKKIKKKKKRMVKCDIKNKDEILNKEKMCSVYDTLIMFKI